MATARKGTVDLQKQDAPYVDPNLNPHAVGYAMGAAARHGKPPKTTVPVAGGPPPSMPALEQPHRTGVPMAAQAPATKGPDSVKATAAAMASHVGRGGSIISPGGGPLEPALGQPTLLPQDTLPDEAKKDPHYQQGMGSESAMNQPHMAMKYGVVRGGQYIHPSQLSGAPLQPQQQRPGAPDDFRKNLRRPVEQTQRDLQALNQAQQQTQQAAQAEDVQPPAHLPRTDEEADEQAAEGLGGAAAHAGDTKESKDARLKQLLANMDDVDFAALQQEMVNDELKNPDQREIVEARLEPLDIDELIMRNQVAQKVPIIPDSFEPTFESQAGDVEMALKQLVTQESKSVSVSEGYLFQKYALMSTTAGTKAINNNLLPSMLDQEGNFNEELFWKKYKWMLKKPMHMLASLGIHYSWFEARVRRLFKAVNAKNG